MASSAVSSVSTFLTSVDLGTCSREVAGLTKACEVDDRMASDSAATAAVILMVDFV